MCFQTIFCGVICKSSRQSLKTGIGKSCSRKEIVLHFIISRSFLFIHSPHTPLPSTHKHTPQYTQAAVVWRRSAGFLWSCWLILVWNGDQTFAVHGFVSSAHLLPLTPADVSTAIIIVTLIRVLLITLCIWTVREEHLSLRGADWICWWQI